MNIITSKHITEQLSLDTLFAHAFAYLEEDLKRWESFYKTPRHVTHYDHGVCELMPCADDTLYTYKYVNAHPANPELGKLSIVAAGMLADVATGYPQLFCDMTLLTAIRTAATSAIAAQHLAHTDSRVLGLIGTGAQSEFQVYAMRQRFDIEVIRYYDRDAAAMEKFAANMAETGVELVACANGSEVVEGVDILTTCICEKAHVELFPYAAVAENERLFINAIGGDCAGKTELDPEVMRNARIVVEFFEQTKNEGEIQNIADEQFTYDSLWEIIAGKVNGRTSDDRIIVFDSVGFGLADFSMMRMLNDLQLGEQVEIVPTLENPKNVFGLFLNGGID